jgi:hypothetical protein
MSDLKASVLTYWLKQACARGGEGGYYIVSLSHILRVCLFI